MLVKAKPRCLGLRTLGHPSPMLTTTSQLSSLGSQGMARIQLRAHLSLPPSPELLRCRLPENPVCHPSFEGVPREKSSESTLQSNLCLKLVHQGLWGAEARLGMVMILRGLGSQLPSSLSPTGFTQPPSSCEQSRDLV